MASFDPYEGGDYTQQQQPRPQTYEQPRPATVQTSQTPQAGTSGPSTPAPSTATPQTSQAPGAPPPGTGTYGNIPMGTDFRYNLNTPGTPVNMQLGQYGNALEGFESSKLNDPTRTSAKYMFGRVASRYAPTQQGFQQLVQDPEFQRLGMQSLGNGKIRLPNGDVIDVVRGFQSGGQAWQWGAETVNGQATDWGAPGQAPGMDPWGQVQQSYLQQQQAWQQQQQQQYQQQLQAWQQYQQQLAAWQQYQQQQQQAQPAAPAAAPAPQVTPYYPPPQSLPASPDYGGTGGYNTGVGLQGGGGSPYSDPYAQTFNYLAQGMPSPYYYG